MYNSNAFLLLGLGWHSKTAFRPPRYYYDCGQPTTKEKDVTMPHKSMRSREWEQKGCQTEPKLEAEHAVNY